MSDILDKFDNILGLDDKSLEKKAKKEIDDFTALLIPTATIDCIKEVLFEKELISKKEFDKKMCNYLIEGFEYRVKTYKDAIEESKKESDEHLERYSTKLHNKVIELYEKEIDSLKNYKSGAKNEG